MGDAEVSVLNSIVRMLCPYCGKGKLFINNNPYNWKNKVTMHKECPECKANFSPEPGFYFGAAYVSYGLSVIIACLTWLTLFLLKVDKMGIILTVMISVVMGISPVTYRFSRALWIGIHAGLQKNKQS